MNESKKYILTTALKLFLQKSFKEVTMKELVEKTGLSKGAFYHYFSSKEQLFLEVLDFFFANIMQHDYEKYSQESFYQFYHDYAADVLSVSERLTKIFEDEQSEEEFNLNYFVLAFDALKLFPEFKEKMMEGQEIELQLWTDTVKRARENGEIKSVMTDSEIAKLFMYLSDGFAMHLMMKGSGMSDMVSPFLTIWDKIYETIKV